MYAKQRPVPYRSAWGGLRPFQRGFGISYVLAIIALAGIASMAVSTMARGRGQHEYYLKTVGDLVTQANAIRSQLNLCAIQYPAGNNGTGFNPQFPAGSTSVAVSTLTCPGNATNLWTGSNGVFQPAVPTGFTGWNYVNDVTGIAITVTSNGSAANTVVLNQLAAKYSASEVTRSGDNFTLWIRK